MSKLPWIGFRFRGDRVDKKLPADKPFRRLMRRTAMKQRSRIEVALHALRRRDMEAQRLASNSHEARRYIEQSRVEHRAERKAAGA